MPSGEKNLLPDQNGGIGPRRPNWAGSFTTRQAGRKRHTAETARDRWTTSVQRPSVRRRCEMDRRAGELSHRALSMKHAVGSNSLGSTLTKTMRTQNRTLMRRKLTIGLKCEHSLNSPVRPEAKEPTTHALSGGSFIEKSPYLPAPMRLNFPPTPSQQKNKRGEGRKN